MLEQMKSRLALAATLGGAVERILDDIVALHGAEFGDLQLAVDDHWLALVAQRGFNPHFLISFRRLSKASGTSCARAFASGRAVVVRDVSQDENFRPYMDIVEHCGYRSVQSTPLVGRDGKCVGVISTHFANVHEPTAIEMSTLVRYGQVAADTISTLLAKREEAVGAQSDLLFEQMLTRTEIARAAAQRAAANLLAGNERGA